MSLILPINLRSFKEKTQRTNRKMRRFLTRLRSNPPREIDRKIAVLEKEVWKETDCMSCANCCKTMSPTYTDKDIKRIAAYLNMSVSEFQQKWLRRERAGDRDWLNKTAPCQFLNPDNSCSVYEVRPADCASFPHFSKKFKYYGHVHNQNVELCPATHRMVEKMMERMNGQ